jgi:hypothetical protein
MSFQPNNPVSPKNSNGKDSMSTSNEPKLTAVNLKNALWQTLQAIKADTMQPAQGDAIASQAR